MIHSVRLGGRLICPSTRAVGFTSSDRFRCCIQRRRPSTRCSRDGAISKCAATWTTTRLPGEYGWFSVSSSTPTSSHGCGRRLWWRSSSAICDRSRDASSQLSVDTKTHCACSVLMSAIPTTAGIGCANSDSARIPLRCSSIGTPRSTCRTTSSPRRSAHSPNENCKISSTMPTTRWH
jgi:hypothetical protein